MDEVSVRTQYRRIRIKYIRGTIAALIDLLELPQKYLEKIPLAFFKNLKNSVEAELILEKESDRQMAGVDICPVGHRLAHFKHGLVDYWYCPKCQKEIRKDDFALKKKEEKWLCEVCLKANDNSKLFKINECTCGAVRK